MYAFLRRSVVTLAAVLLLSSSSVFALNLPVRTFEEGRIPKVGRVFGMLQDNQGLFWIWGSRGITIYDGSSFRHLGTDDGLPSEYIYTLHVEPDGNILISSYGGLSRFNVDSRTIEPILAFRPDSPVRDVAVHPDGLLLASDEGVLFEYKGVLFQIPTMTPFREGNANCMVNRLAYDKGRDVVWASSDRFGLIRIDLAKIYPLLEMKRDTTTSTDPIVDPTVFLTSRYKIQPLSIFAIDNADVRYQAWLDAVDLFVPEKMRLPNAISVWTTDGVLYNEVSDELITWDFRDAYHLVNGELVPLLDDLPAAAMHTVKEQWDGSLSICRSDGLYRVFPDRVQHIGEEQGLFSNNIVAHVHDHQGHNWIIDHHGDLHRMPEKGIDVLSGQHYSGLRDLRKIIVDGDRLLLSSSQHLFTFKDGELEEIPLTQSFDGEIIDMRLGPNGGLFLATPTKLYRLDLISGQLRSLLPDGPTHVGRMVFGGNGKQLWALFQNSLFRWNGSRMVKNSDFLYINPLFIDVLPSGKVYVGLWASLTSITPTTTRVYLNDLLYENPDSDNISSRPTIEQEVLYPKGKMLDALAAIAGATGPDGAYYVGTFNAGIVRIVDRSDPVETVDRMTVEDVRTGLPNNTINSLTVAPNGTLFFILGKGAVKIDKEGLHNLDLPLPEDATLMDITCDMQGRMYYGTSLGLYIQSGNRLYRFDKNQGLPETSVSKVQYLSDGKILAQQQNGFYILDPAVFDEVNFSSTAPILTDLHTLKTPLTFQDRVTLPMGERTVLASLALPAYFNESLHEYSWRLWPLEEEWQPWSSRNTLTYTHLRPGEYKLEYRARNGIEPVIQEGKPIELIVPPKLHETGLSLAAIIMGAGLLLMFIVLQLIRRIQAKQRRELEVEMEKLRVAMQLASTVAHEFNNPLQVLQGAYYMLQREDLSPEERKRYLDLIPQYTTRMNELIQRLLGLNSLRETDYAAGMKILNLDDAKADDAKAKEESPSPWDRSDNS